MESKWNAGIDLKSAPFKLMVEISQIEDGCAHKPLKDGHLALGVFKVVIDELRTIDELSV